MGQESITRAFTCQFTVIPGRETDMPARGEKQDPDERKRMHFRLDPQVWVRLRVLLIESDLSIQKYFEWLTEKAVNEELVPTKEEIARLRKEA